MRSLIRIALGLAVVATIVPVSGCAACSAAGYLYSGPAVVALSEPLGTDLSVAACFGDVCDPAPLTRDDGQRWEVPQEAPFLAETDVGAGSPRLLRVVVADAAGNVIDDDIHDVPVTSERTGFFGQCPGPFAFEPVAITLSG